jgi:monovalent cation:H+ antiporter-2, CPA2 family
VLRRARPEGATSAVIAIPDDMVASLIVRRLHRLNPELPVVARGHSEGAVLSLEVEGADEVVVPEFEAGLEMVRHALLHHHPVEPDAVNAYLTQQREQRYHPHQHPATPVVS